MSCRATVDPGSLAEGPRRLFSLDILRGLAALAVVFWHWQHFFYAGTRRMPYHLERLPLYHVLEPLYTSRWLALDLFFALSGFVFFWLYSRRVAEGTISGWDFAVLRLSRLYPLHVLTLLLVAGGQMWFKARTSGDFVYGFNDTWHFLLNLLMASSWGMEKGPSFNGPAWSVSVEVLLYALFFQVCRRLPISAPLLLLFSVSGFFLLAQFSPLIGRGMGSFFLGGCMFLAYASVIRSARSQFYSRLISVAAFSAWLITVAASRIDIRAVTAVQWLVPAGPAYFPNPWTTLFLFPLTILWLAVTETRHPGLGSRYAALGDLSYSSYLLHFPLQMLTAGLLMQTRATRDVFYSPLLMLLFFAVLIVLSLASHAYYEVPMQRYLRGRALAAVRTAASRAEHRAPWPP